MTPAPERGAHGQSGRGSGSVTVAVLGLGEAGSAIAADLCAAGAVVRGFDPIGLTVAGVTGCRDDADACRGCAVVLSLTCAHEAEDALAAALPAMRAGAIYADLNTASAGLKARLAARAADAEIEFADVALMSPVSGSGLRTPMLASGPAAARFAALLRALGASVEVLPGPAGTAATRKLVRSVYYKGMAAAVTEALRAAEAAGCADWLRDNIRHELTTSSAATLDRLERGVRTACGAAQRRDGSRGRVAARTRRAASNRHRERAMAAPARRRAVRR